MWHWQLGSFLTCPSFKFMSANRASHLLILGKHTHITRVPCPQAQKVTGSVKKISVSRLTDMEIVLPGICCLHTSLKVCSTQTFQCTQRTDLVQFQSSGCRRKCRPCWDRASSWSESPVAGNNTKPVRTQGHLLLFANSNHPSHTKGEAQLCSP